MDVRNVAAVPVYIHICVRGNLKVEWLFEKKGKGARFACGDNFKIHVHYLCPVNNLFATSLLTMQTGHTVWA